LSARLTQHHIVIGQSADGTDVRLAPQDGLLLIAGPSGSGKTRMTTALLERFAEAAYQFCIIDPEGDYDEFAGAIALRGGDRRALADEAVRVLKATFLVAAPVAAGHLRSEISGDFATGALGSGPRGRRFKSSRPDQLIPKTMVILVVMLGRDGS
jgi:hypothetical protein